MNGTSMASPTAAGILALITERYKQLHAGAYPDGALLKALVTNSAVDLGNPGPDFTFGFGMISGRTTVEALEQNHYFSGSVSNNAQSAVHHSVSSCRNLPVENFVVLARRSGPSCSCQLTGKRSGSDGYRTWWYCSSSDDTGSITGKCK